MGVGAPAGPAGVGPAVVGPAVVGPAVVGPAVVVPTIGRLALLERCLDGLSRQTTPPGEVLVVHDGAADPVLARWAGRLPLRSLVVAATGAAARRNAGWQASSAPLVAFTDDDCEPSPGWLAALVAATAQADLAHGPVAPHPADSEVRSAFGRTVVVDRPTGLFPGANLAVRRSALERVAGFDPSLHAGEDTDLAHRVLAGGTAVWAPEALVLHAVRPVTFPQHLRSLPRWRSLPEVVRRHPALRAELPGRLFWKTSHPLALLALGGLVLMPWRARAGLLALPLLARSWRARGPWFGTQVAVADAAEVLVVVAGSARARSVLL